MAMRGHRTKGFSDRTHFSVKQILQKIWNVASRKSSLLPHSQIFGANILPLFFFPYFVPISNFPYFFAVNVGIIINVYVGMYLDKLM